MDYKPMLEVWEDLLDVTVGHIWEDLDIYLTFHLQNTHFL